MPRRKKPIDATLTGPLVEFAHGLRDLRALAENPTYVAMARKGLASKSGLSAADNGKELPSWEVTRAYVLACDGDLDEWEKRWTETKEKIGKLSPDAAGSAEPDRAAAPRPVTALTQEGFREALREVYDWAGNPAYRVLSDRADKIGLVLARSTISDMLCSTKHTMPTSTKLVSYLTVCALPADQHGEWLAVRKAILQAQGRDRRRSLAEAPEPVDSACDPLVRVPAKGAKKAGWLIATSDLPQVQPLRDEAWATLPDDVERRLHQQLQSGEDMAVLFAEYWRPGARSKPLNADDRAPQKQWTSGPPLPVTIGLCVVLVAVVVLCVFIVFHHVTG